MELIARAAMPAYLEPATLVDRDDPAIHALNAVHIDGRWSRIDARGNKPGVDAQFSLTEERLAFPIREQYGEVDYPYLFAEPHAAIVHTLLSNDNAVRSTNTASRNRCHRRSLFCHRQRSLFVIPSAVEGQLVSLPFA
jgi:hypothetical protein